MKKRYIIWAPTLKLNSGGVTVLHLLADIIVKLGYEAYLWPSDNNFETFLTNAKYNVSLANKEMINDDAIIIYPEIVIGNPLNAKNVVRWLLNEPGVLGGDGIFGENDIVFYFSKAFSEEEENLNYLHINELYNNMFINKNLSRNGSCYVMRKGKGRKIIHDLSNSVEITDSTPSEELINTFNEKNYFYCYDTASFLAVQAALCGCISIVVPVEGLSAEEWIAKSETRKYGIAYGEENIDHAVATLEKVKPHLKNLEAKSYENVKDFILKTQNWANNNKDTKFLTPTKFIPNNTPFGKVEELIENGEFTEVKKILNKKIKNSPNNIEALNYLSIVEILENNYDKAKEIVDNILLLDKTNIIAKDNFEYLNEIT